MSATVFSGFILRSCCAACNLECGEYFSSERKGKTEGRARRTARGQDLRSLSGVVQLQSLECEEEFQCRKEGEDGRKESVGQREARPEEAKASS